MREHNPKQHWEVLTKPTVQTAQKNSENFSNYVNRLLTYFLI